MLSQQTVQFEDFPATDFAGTVVRPGDDAYATVRPVWNSRYDNQNPALIARCLNAQDVAQVVEYANRKDVGIAIRSGGHGIDGYSMPDGAIVIDLSLMKGVTVDPERRTVRMEAGVTLGQLDAATQEHGLAVPVGTATDTGAAGLILGGGLGYLTRRFGMSVDNLLSVELVTADGRQLTCSATEHADLFWGLKGAGHNLAIVTSFELQAHPVGPEVVSGFVLYPIEAAVPVLTQLDRAVAETPRELTTYAVLTHAPPFPGLPSDVIGTPIFALLIVYSGEVGNFARDVAPIFALGGPPLADMTRTCTWCESQAMLDPIVPPGRRQNSRGGYLTGINASVAEMAVEQIRKSPPPPPFSSSGLIAFEQIGGASNEFDENSTAYSREGSEWLWAVSGAWDSADDDATFDAWTYSTGELFAPHSLSSAYINLSDNSSASWLTQVYGSTEKWQRICRLKAEWDPENRLRYNKNVMRAQHEVESALVAS